MATAFMLVACGDGSSGDPGSGGDGGQGAGGGQGGNVGPGGSGQGGAEAKRQLVAVGYTGQIYASTDGETWAPQSSGVTARLLDVAFFNGIYVAVGHNGTALWSPNGEEWTQADSGTSSAIVSLAVGDGRLVGLVAPHVQTGNPDIGSSVFSDDGKEWSPGMDTGPGGGWMRFGASRYVSNVRTDPDPSTVESRMAVSTDGASWTVTDPIAEQPIRYDFVNGSFYAEAHDPTGTLLGHDLLRSADGETWTVEAVTVQGFGQCTVGLQWDHAPLAYGNGVYVMGAKGSTSGCVTLGAGAFTMATSTDGLAWTVPTDSAHWGRGYADIVFANGVFVGVGGQSRGHIKVSTDGSVWNDAVEAAEFPFSAVTY